MPQSDLVRKLDFIYFDAGGGHRAAANALRQVMLAQDRPFEIRMVNLQETLDSIDVFRKMTGLRLQDIYNLLLRKGWTIGSAQLLAGMHLVIGMFHGVAVRALAKFWRESRPDLVVSLVPNFNRALYDGMARALPGVPLVTVLTDIADYPPHFWMERQDQYVICGSAKAAEQALGMGYDPKKVFGASGMILNPRFHEVEPLSAEQRASARQTLGLKPEEPAGIVLFGGHGSPVMVEIAKSLGNRQLIMICGHSRKLRAQLQGLRRRAPMYIEGFTKEIPRYMQLADYVIGKPGPGSISEAIAMGLPVIVERNAWTLPQERYNAEWVLENGAGMVLPNFRDIAGAVDKLLDPAEYSRYKDAVSRIRNRAVYEIPDILEAILRGEPSPLATPRV
jgi:UDP-N-acetylglucosamine:LPS N-acetylglucosamine transferase